jgi:sulfide:quinone oxidoreductase
VLGAGFGGLELTTRLFDELGDVVDIVLIDKADGFVFGFSKLDVLVETDAGEFQADIMVVALGADLDPGATPGLVEAGREFYTVDGAFAARDVLDSFGGGRVIVGVTSTPFKCPPAPSETALMLRPRRSHVRQWTAPERTVRRAVRPAAGRQG